MLGRQSQQKVRKGTKSCTECSLQQPQRLPSRYRISQLESKVANLTKFIHDVEAKFGNQPAQTSGSTAGRGLESDDLGDDSSGSDIDASHQPAHIRSLFQNDWLSVDAHRQLDQPQDRRVKVPTHLFNLARQALQKLIPPKDEVLGIVRSASEWLPILHNLFPQPGAATCQQELFERFDEMCSPDVDAISLATWLLTVALTGQQSPQEDISPHVQHRRSQEWSKFCRAVSNAVENNIMSHDRLVGTIPGLGMAMHFCRLQISQGNFQKVWVRLRHTIAIAEVMGLHKAWQSTQTSRTAGAESYETQLHKAQLWESLTAANGLLGMIINLPPETRRYPQDKTQALVVEGVVQPRVYLSKLTDIVAKIQHLEDLNMTPESKPEFYSSTFGLIGELKALMSQTPKSWWTSERDRIKPDHIVQFIHNSIMVRAHLPFVMKHDLGEECFYSRLACMDACESVTELYQFLRGTLPPGIFMTRPVDLLVFIATVVLLLITYSSSPTNRFNTYVNKAKTDSIVKQVTEIMTRRSNDLTSAGFTENCVTTINSLHKLLQQDNTPRFQDLVLKVPLLGKVHVRRNVRPADVSGANTLSRKQAEPETHRAGEQSNSQRGQQVFNTNPSTMGSSQTPRDWQWDSLTWTVEETHENFFQDALMAEVFDPFAMWPEMYEQPFNS
ncbi:hypothetical protein EYZ11_008528 [Aspergillus tanneri]|uniref:Transcription factor domain-containing protein n=1 Tax=Aspergillus tanneri TaxID=1220188 RepID=A0A4S3JCF4_9EURO|nr:hypothetical protein EYZ11_008528 [Aspergillus tanneri]